jgi:hypothetical protein
MVMVVHFSVCDKDFDWEEGDPCEDIPFPFGIRGTALSGFELKCQDGKATLLTGEITAVKKPICGIMKFDGL